MCTVCKHFFLCCIHVRCGTWDSGGLVWLAGLCVLEGSESRSVCLEWWVEEERGTATKVEVSGTPPSVSWVLTRGI